MSLARAQAGDGALDLVAQVAHPADDRFVDAVDAVEVLGAIDEFVVAVGVDDHAEHVRGAGLIDRDEALAQRDQRPLQVRPHHRQVLLGDVELGHRPIEFRLLGVEPDPDRGLLVAQRRDLAGQPVDLSP